MTHPDSGSSLRFFIASRLLAPRAVASSFGISELQLAQWMTWERLDWTPAEERILASLAASDASAAAPSQAASILKLALDSCSTTWGLPVLPELRTLGADSGDDYLRLAFEIASKHNVNFLARDTPSQVIPIMAVLALLCLSERANGKASHDTIRQRFVGDAFGATIDLNVKEAHCAGGGFDQMTLISVYSFLLNLSRRGLVERRRSSSPSHSKEREDHPTDSASSDAPDAEFDPVFQPDATKALNALIASAQLRQQLSIQQRLPARAEFAALHCVFLGPPGTGKTSAAKYFASRLHSRGVLPSSNFTSLSRTQLVGQYIGETEDRASKALAAGVGGVIFIDEIYAIADGEQGGRDFGRHVVETLLLFMEQHQDDTAVVVAGYEDPVRKFMATNEGLRSRFDNWIHFAPYSAETCLELLIQRLPPPVFVWDRPTRRFALEYLGELSEREGFASGRSVRTLAKKLFASLAQTERVASISTLQIRRSNFPPIESILGESA